MYINTLTSAYPISEYQIRLDNPNTSFGSPFQAPEDYAWVFPTPTPTYDPITQGVRETTPQISAKGNYEQVWEIISLEPDVVTANQAAEEIRLREAAKAKRTADVAAIKVTTQAGNTFDGDEVSQGRMSRAIIALSTGLAPSVNWVLADNSVIQATAAELTEALVLAGQAQAAIWVI